MARGIGPSPVQQTYRAGMKRDFSRDQMPPGSVWNILDFLPEVVDAPLQKRGGWSMASGATSAITSTSDHIVAGLWAPFSAGSVNVFFDEDGHAFAVTAGTSAQDVGAAVPTISPVFYSNTVIVPASDGTTAPKKITWNGSAFAVANLGGSPPGGKYGIIYKDVLWLAASSASSDTIVFSTAGNPEATWDLVNKVLAVSFPITGMVALANAVFVFMESRTARIRGSVPPPDTDFIVDDPMYNVGCTDNRSIATWRDKVIWGSGEGLFISDGSAMEDLTALCGQKSWWLDIMAGRDGLSTGASYDKTTWTIASTVHRDYYLYCVMNGATKVDAGMIDLKTYAWTRLSNMAFDFLWNRPFPSEVYGGRRGDSRIATLSGIWVPSAATKNDGDGTSVLPSVETPYFTGGPGLKTFLNAYASWFISDAASDNPSLTLSYLTSPEDTSYTALIPTMAVGADIQRDHFPLNFPGYGIAFKVAQANPSADTRFYTIELDAESRRPMQ